MKKFRRYVYSFWHDPRTWQTHTHRHTRTPDDGIGRAYASHRAAKMCRVQVSSVDKQVVEQLDIVRDRRTWLTTVSLLASSVAVTSAWLTVTLALCRARSHASVTGALLLSVLNSGTVFQTSSVSQTSKSDSLNDSPTHCCAWPARAVATSTTSDPAPMTTASRLCTRDPLLTLLTYFTSLSRSKQILVASLFTECETSD